jgi:hypothetical protein
MGLTWQTGMLGSKKIGVVDLGKNFGTFPPLLHLPAFIPRLALLNSQRPGKATASILSVSYPLETAGFIAGLIKCRQWLRFHLGGGCYRPACPPFTSALGLAAKLSGVSPK